MKHNKLDNPIWNALVEKQADLCLDLGSFKFYPNEYCVFGAFEETSDSSGLELYAKENPSFFIVGDCPPIPEGLLLESETICLQMIYEGSMNETYRESITTLDESHQKDLMDLVNVAFPDYFKKKTAELGQYYGIYKDGQLVSITGERLHMNDYIEISGVMTHPSYRGKGLATEVIKKTTEEIIKKNKIPFLHTAKDNINAIRIYESLGYTTRREMSFWKFVKNEKI